MDLHPVCRASSIVTAWRHQHVPRRHRVGERRKIEQRMSSYQSLNDIPSVQANRSFDRQRTFRERKEQQVHELDVKISKLESKCHTLRLDNQCLQLALKRVCRYNEVLRAAFPQSPKFPWLISNRHTSTPDEASQKDYNAKLLANTSESKDCDEGLTRVSVNSHDMSAAQPWSLLKGHPLVQQGQIRLADVCKQLKGDDTPEDQRQAIEDIIVWAALECLRRIELGVPDLPS